MLSLHNPGVYMLDTVYCYTVIGLFTLVGEVTASLTSSTMFM